MLFCVNNLNAQFLILQEAKEINGIKKGKRQGTFYERQRKQNASPSQTQETNPSLTMIEIPKSINYKSQS